MESNATAQDVAEWMLEELKQLGALYQESVAQKIRAQFGDAYVYTNANGNWAIRKDVLSAFNKLSKDSVVWLREDRYWRLRQPDDKPGRQQD